MDYDSSQTSKGTMNLSSSLFICVLFVLLFLLSLASASIWFTHWLSFSKVCCCSPLHCYPAFLCPFISIFICGSLSPLFHSVHYAASLLLPSCPSFNPPSTAILMLSSSLLCLFIRFSLQWFQHFHFNSHCPLSYLYYTKLISICIASSKL